MIVSANSAERGEVPIRVVIVSANSAERGEVLISVVNVSATALREMRY